MPSVNIALIGYAFMGRAHSNAYRQVTPFFSPRLTPRMKVLCGRTASAVDKAAQTLGWDEAVLSPSWAHSTDGNDTLTCWLAYSTQEECDADETGAHAPTITRHDGDGASAEA